MWRDNPTWGEDRIAGELAKLGYKVDSRTVAKYRPTGLSRGRGQRWTTFIRNHLQETWARDLLVLVTARLRVLYVFVVLLLGRRRIVHIGVTEHPTGAWTAQRPVEAAADSEQAPRFLVHDRDSVYGADFRRRVHGLGIRVLLTPPRAPQANAFAERVIGTLRPHRGLDMQPPDGARHLPPPRPQPGTPIVAAPILAGLHHSYGFADPRPPPNDRVRRLTAERSFSGGQPPQPARAAA